MNNKRGQFLTIGLFIVAAILLTLIIIFPKIRFILIGVSLFIAFFTILIKGDINKTKGIILGVLFIASIFFMFGSGVLQTQFGGTLTINSVSKNINVISSATDLTGVWWLVNANVGGLSGGQQSLVGTLTAAKTQAETGSSINYPLTIKASAIEEKLEYKIANTGTPIYVYTYAFTFSDDGWKNSECTTYTIFKKNNAPDCPSGYNSDIRIDVPANKLIFTRSTSNYYTCARICYKKVQTGVLGDIQPTRVTDSFDITLTANGKTDTQTLTSDNRHADYIIDGKTLATVDYPSNSITGNYPPLATGFKGYYDTIQSNNWKITTNTRYQDYNNKLSTFESLLLTRWGANAQIGVCPTCTWSNSLAFINDFKSEASKVSTVEANMRTDDYSITQDQVWGNRADMNNGLLTVELPQQINVPIINIKVRADWLGIKLDIGKPSITSLSCDEFTAGTTSKINVDVKNIGNVAGNFRASVICDTIKSTYTSPSFSLNSGASQSIIIPIDAGTFADDKYDNCIVKVEDTGKASNFVTSQTVCHIKKPALCVENEFYNENNCIKQCKSGIITTIECCDATSEILYDEVEGYYCQAPIPPIPDLECKFYQEPYTKEVNDWGTLGWRHIINKPLVHTESGCKTTGWVYFAIGILAVLIFIVSVVLIKSKPKKKGKRK